MACRDTGSIVISYCKFFIYSFLQNKTARPRPVYLWTVVDVQKWLRRHCSDYYPLYWEKFQQVIHKYSMCLGRWILVFHVFREVNISQSFGLWHHIVWATIIEEHTVSIFTTEISQGGKVAGYMEEAQKGDCAISKGKSSDFLCIWSLKALFFTLLSS